ncbi:MAG: DUF2007 domain-containing protein [Myxococcota bacterium]|jgi:hypothetical protein
MPFCPECRSAFNDDVKQCEECGVPLVEKLPDEGETADFIEIFKAASLVEAEALEAALKENDIEVIVRTTVIPSIPMMGDESMIPIEVRFDQVDEARKIIQEMESSQSPEIEEQGKAD